MKHFLALSLLVSSAYASEYITDYSQCQRALMMEGYHINAEGQISSPMGFQPNPDVKTSQGLNGETEHTYTFKGQQLDLKGKPIERIVKVRKDKEGNIIGVNTAQDKIDPQIINMNKQWALQNAVYSGLTADALTYDPMVQIKEGKENAQGFNFGNYVPLSKLSKEQAKQFGVDIDELRRLRKETRRDKKQLKKIEAGYKKLLDKSHMLMPNGSEMAFEIKDHACRVKQIQKVVHDTKSKTNQAGQRLNGDRCEKVNKISKKYQKELGTCSTAHIQMSQELMTLDGQQGGLVGGINGGSQVNMGYGVGGYPGGMAGGYVGGVAGGYNPYGGFFMGSQEVFDCQNYFGESISFGSSSTVKGQQSGSGSGNQQ